MCMRMRVCECEVVSQCVYVQVSVFMCVNEREKVRVSVMCVYVSFV